MENITIKFVGLLALTSRTPNSTAQELPVPLRKCNEDSLRKFYKIIRYFATNGLSTKYRACYMVTKYIW
jgi:hypothetical protein